MDHRTKLEGSLEFLSWLRSPTAWRARGCLILRSWPQFLRPRSSLTDLLSRAWNQDTQQYHTSIITVSFTDLPDMTFQFNLLSFHHFLLHSFSTLTSNFRVPLAVWSSYSSQPDIFYLTINRSFEKNDQLCINPNNRRQNIHLLHFLHQLLVIPVALKLLIISTRNFQFLINEKWIATEIHFCFNKE